MLKAIFCTFLFLGALGAVDIQINTKDYESLPSGAKDYDAIVVNSKGEMSEMKGAFNPANGILSVPSLDAGAGASVFVPDLDARYLNYDGNWINPQGSYWDGRAFVNQNNPNWQGDWNNYWHKDWKNKWEPYYRNHQNDNNWRWKDQPKWRGHWHKHAKHHRRHQDKNRTHHKHHGGKDVHHHKHVHHHTHHHHGSHHSK